MQFLGALLQVYSILHYYLRIQSFIYKQAHNSQVGRLS